MRIAAASAALLLATTSAVLTGCGEDDPFAAYCEQVTEQQQPLSEALAGDGPTALIAALPSFEALQEVAPDDLRDEWQVVVTAVQGLDDALNDAGVDPATYDREEPPEGLSEDDADRIDAAARRLTRPDTVAALAGVQQQARDVCKTPLSL